MATDKGAKLNEDKLKEGEFIVGVYGYKARRGDRQVLMGLGFIAAKL